MYKNETYLTIRKRTLKKSNAQLSSCGEYRYINHEDSVATLGFSSLKELFEYTHIRFDEVTVPLMQRRYKQLLRLSQSPHLAKYKIHLEWIKLSDLCNLLETF